MAGLSNPLSVVDHIDNDAPDADQRQSMVGGSQAGALLNRGGCARALGYEKTGTPKDVLSDYSKERALGTRAIMDRGHLLEDVAAQLYMKATGRSVIRRNYLVRHPEHPGAGVHTDRIIVAGGGKPTGDAEIKSHSEGPFLNMLRNGLPPRHILQLQWSLFCTGHIWGSFIILGVFGPMPLKHFDVDRDPELMDIFAGAVDSFWNTLARNELPPQLPDPADIRCKVCRYRLTCRGQILDPEEYERLISERDGKRVLTQIQNDELDEALADHALIQGELAELYSRSKDEPGALQLVTQRIKDLLGDQTAVMVNKRWIVYCYDHLWSGIDSQRLKEEEPEIYKKYYVKRKPTGTKVLRVYTTEDEEAA